MTLEAAFAPAPGSLEPPQPFFSFSGWTQAVIPWGWLGDAVTATVTKLLRTEQAGRHHRQFPCGLGYMQSNQFSVKDVVIIWVDKNLQNVQASSYIDKQCRPSDIETNNKGFDSIFEVILLGNRGLVLAIFASE